MGRYSSEGAEYWAYAATGSAPMRARAPTNRPAGRRQRRGSEASLQHLRGPLSGGPDTNVLLMYRREAEREILLGLARIGSRAGVTRQAGGGLRAAGKRGWGWRARGGGRLPVSSFWQGTRLGWVCLPN